MENYASFNNQSAQSAGLATQAPRQPRLEQLAERFEKSLTELQELNGRISNTADRVLGPVPTAADSNKQLPTPSASVNKLEAMVEGLGHLLGHLRQNADRLGAL